MAQRKLRLRPSVHFADTTESLHTRVSEPLNATKPKRSNLKARASTSSPISSASPSSPVSSTTSQQESPLSPNTSRLYRRKQSRDYYSQMVRTGEMEKMVRERRQRHRQAEKHKIVLDQQRFEEEQEELAREEALRNKIAKFEGSPPSPVQSARMRWGTKCANDGLALEFAPVYLQDDHSLVRVAVMQNGMALKFATDIVKTARDVVLAAVTNDWRALAYANRDLHNDRAFMRAAISLDWHCLQFGSRSIQSNEKILLTAVRQEWKALEFAPLDLRADKLFMFKCIEVHGKTLKYGSSDVRDDKPLVLKAVKQHAGALEFASERLKDDRDVGLAAVRNDGMSLQHSSPTLRSDPKVVLEAVEQSGGGALRFASERVNEARCPQNHLLKAFEAPWDGWYCSLCASTMLPAERIRKFTKGVVLHGCRRCEYDLCDLCFRRNATAISPTHIVSKLEQEKDEASRAAAAVNKSSSSLIFPPSQQSGLSSAVKRAQKKMKKSLLENEKQEQLRHREQQWDSTPTAKNNSSSSFTGSLFAKFTKAAGSPQEKAFKVKKKQQRQAATAAVTAAAEKQDREVARKARHFVRFGGPGVPKTVSPEVHGGIALAAVDSLMASMMDLARATSRTTIAVGKTDGSSPVLASAAATATTSPMRHRRNLHPPAVATMAGEAVSGAESKPIRTHNSYSVPLPRPRPTRFVSQRRSPPHPPREFAVTSPQSAETYHGEQETY